MLSILGPAYRHCDRVSRRAFLHAGGLALGGLSLPHLLRAEDLSAAPRRHKAVIMVFLSGGPPHQDMVDLKPGAPAEVRGEFRPIRTRVPGIDVCEHLPRLAARMDKLTVIRSLVGSEGRHDAFQCMHGQTQQRQPAGGWPALGSAVAKLQGSVHPAVPPFVGLSPRMKTTTWADPGRPGFLGRAYGPFLPNAEGTGGMTLSIPAERLADRRGLLDTFDGWRRGLDANPAEGRDPYTERALEILTSNRLAEALDLGREPAGLRDRYGRGSPEPAGYGDAGPLLNDYFLTARRLVEAGARVVTLAYGRWDWHGKPHGTTFENARHHLPMLDVGLSALLDDLEQRGRLDDTAVVVWGEFGRTPKINQEAGRDHWPAVGCAMLFGGGLRAGQVIGSTTGDAGAAKDRPVHFQEVFATLYHTLGIDTDTVTLPDLTGRPQYLVENAKPLPELV